MRINLMNQRRARDKDKTVQDILTAARQLFSEMGIYGTSIRDIEKASGVSKGLILHHFGTKEKLYAAVQDLLAQGYVTMMDTKRRKSKNFRDMVAAAVRSAFEYTKNNPEYRRISLWSYLEGQERNTELEKRFIKALIAAMRDGQQSGVVREDIDAFLMPFIIRGTIDYWIQKEKLVQELIDNGENQEGGPDDRLIDALTQLFTK
ncbi:MAG: TetR/AcrR family transcriptional regulator [Dehalococcoidia bacterium]|nr:MAG: TetR/AcrR family transcriptional regulator [Dehalococcoidia bacterium]